MSIPPLWASAARQRPAWSSRGITPEQADIQDSVDLIPRGMTECVARGQPEEQTRCCIDHDSAQR